VVYLRLSRCNRRDHIPGTWEVVEFHWHKR